MEGVNVTLLKNTTKVVEIYSKSKILEAIRDVQEKTNQLLSDLIDNASNGNVETGPVDKAGEDSNEDDDDADPLNKKFKIS